MADSKQATKIALLFGYNGTGYSGLERTKGARTVENDLLTAMASLGNAGSAQSKKITFVGISRASTTEEGEHATRQVLSLEILGAVDPAMLDVNKLNAALPADSIRVYAISYPNADFSARRSCDARTYEYLLPTYAFAAPPPETFYANRPQDEPIPAPLPEGPNESLFKTFKRSTTMNRKASRKDLSERQPQAQQQHGYPSPPATPASQPQVAAVQAEAPHMEDEKRTGTLSRFFQSLRRPTKKRPNESASSSAPFAETPVAPAQPVAAPLQPQRRQTSTKPQQGSSNGGVDEDDETILTTIRRSLSRRKGSRSRSMPAPDSEDHIERRFLEEAEALNNASPVFYDPLLLPTPTESELQALRNYKINQRQFELLQHVVSLFRGTHNFHNYIPGATYEDPRCYMRILNIEVSQPETHNGMEWVRIKVQAKAFARFQIRKMIALLILIIRTNTPRSILGNSFGYSKIDIPEAPGHALILDESHYTAYNSTVAPQQQIDFAGAVDAVESFRHRSIHEHVYAEEAQEMRFEEWTRSIDRYSFLYAYYLNERGVVGARNAFIREGK